MNYTGRIAVFAAAVLLSVFHPAPVLSQEAPAGRIRTSEVLLRLDDYRLHERSFRVSPDSRHVAVAAMEAEHDVVVVDGGVTGRHDYVGADSISFSPDSRRVAYVAGDAEGRFVVVDGERFGSYTSVKDEPPVFSPDGTRLAFVAAEGGAEFVVELSLAEEAGDASGTPSSGQEEASAGTATRKHGGFESIIKGSLTYSPDGGRLAYIAVREGKSLVVEGGSEGARYDQIAGDILWGAGGDAVYVAMKDGGWRVVTGAGEGKVYQSVRRESLVLTPDGSPMYAAVSEGRQLVVQGGDEGPPRDDVGCIAAGPGAVAAYTFRAGNSWSVYYGGADGPAYDRIGGCVLISPDGRHMAYTAMRGPDWFVVMDGRETGPYSGVAERSLTFGPGGSRLAYVAQSATGEWAPVVDGRKLRAARSIPGGLVFSPDGGHIAYVGVSGGKQFVAVDGTNTAAYDGIVIWSGGRVAFDDEKTLHYIAVDKRVFSLVEESIE